MQCEGDLPLLTETLGVVVVGVDEEAAQVSVGHAAVLTDRSLEVAEIGKPVDGPALGVDLDGVAKKRRGLVLVSSFGVILQPVHVDQIEREQLLNSARSGGGPGRWTPAPWCSSAPPPACGTGTRCA